MQPTPGQSAQPVPPPPSKSKSILPLILIIISALVALVCGSIVTLALIGAQTGKPTSTPDESTGVALSPEAVGGRGGHTIRFEVTATSGHATLVNWSTLEDSAVLSDQQTPWSKEAHLDSAAGLVGVNASTADGLIACKIYVDGGLLDEGESEGTVNCSGTIR